MIGGGKLVRPSQPFSGPCVVGFVLVLLGVAGGGGREGRGGEGEGWEGEGKM